MNAANLDSGDGWRATHLGCLMGRALERFDARVRELISASAEAPLALSNLAARDQVGAAPIHITRHLPLGGARVTELARRAGTTKQSMSTLVRECEAWGLVTRAPDPHDARARRIVFTAAGLDWLAAYKVAVTQAESEFQAAVGEAVTTVVKLGLEAYGSGG
ncbi:MAG: MarR family transcriptional regulator [Burkholderiaceae bacterium]|nr:MAG: MarR family transcriptional regulator [Burkholderiaceae bacterium]